MAKAKVLFTEHYASVIRVMTSRGVLLGSYDAAGKANLMTIGWGAIGSMWGIPVWMVLVRPSRYTFNCIEHSGCFSVNVPSDDMAMACAVCGSRSGRDTDKIAASGLTVEKAGTVLAPIVSACPVTYECQVVHSNDVLPAKLADEILTDRYIDGDYHRIFYGKILNVLADPNAAQLLGK